MTTHVPRGRISDPVAGGSRGKYAAVVNAAGQSEADRALAVALGLPEPKKSPTRSSRRPA